MDLSLKRGVILLSKQFLIALRYLKAVFFGEGQHLLAVALSAPCAVNHDEAHVNRLRLPVGVSQQKVAHGRSVVFNGGHHEFIRIVPPVVEAVVYLIACHGEGILPRAPHGVGLFVIQPACDDIPVAGLVGSESHNFRILLWVKIYISLIII